MDQTPSEPFRVLFVCTGNLCRSPFAELHTRFLLDAWLGPGSRRFVVTSAGVDAVVGSGVHPLSRNLLIGRDDHPAVEGFRARRLVEDDVADADLVLTMTRRHRSRVLADVPSALRRTFTLRELARLLDGLDPRDVASLPPDPVARARALVPAALAQRGAHGPVPAEDDAVPDPIGGDAEVHADAARVIDAAVRRVLGAIVPPRPRRLLESRTRTMPRPGLLPPPPPGRPCPPGPSGRGEPPHTVAPGPVVAVPAPRDARRRHAAPEPHPTPDRRTTVALTPRPRPV